MSTGGEPCTRFPFAFVTSSEYCVIRWVICETKNGLTFAMME
jgi:hypothetical protein